MDKKKPEDGGPILKRDEHNRLDDAEVTEVVDSLTKKLITEQRAVQKELSMRHIKTNRRDIVVKTLIYQRNTVNGIVIRDDYQNPVFEKLSEDPLDPHRYNLFDYVDGEILAKEQPMSASSVTRWTMGMYKAVINYLARMNAMDRV